MARPSNILISTVKRNQRFRGPSPSSAQNSLQDELIRDLTAFQQQFNNFIVPLTKLLPDSTDDSSVDAFRDGLDGRTLYVNSVAVNSGALATYYNSNKGRPNTVYEQFLHAYNYIDEAIDALELDVSSSGSGGGLTSTQKARIGINIFDSSQTSTSTSLDGKTTRNESNILQIAKDLYGSGFVNLTSNGNASLTNSVRAMVDALLELHGGNWDDDITVSHGVISASDITTGTMNQERVGPSSSTGTGVDDSYTGTPSHLVHDLNVLRTQLKNAKGTAGFTTTISPDGTWSGAGTPDSIVDILALKGSGTRTSTNPWGYTYTNIESLENILTTAQTYVGRASLTDDSPSYSATIDFSNGDSHTTAIGALASVLVTHSGDLVTVDANHSAHLADLTNPHEVNLSQASALGGSIDASQVLVTDSGGFYDTSITVEEALQEIFGIFVTVSGLLTVEAVTVSGHLVEGTDNRTVYTNEGASTQIGFTLPLAAPGLVYEFVVQDADGIMVHANTADTIRIGTDATPAAGNVSSTTIGSCLRLVAINTTEWYATSSMGTWVVST